MVVLVDDPETDSVKAYARLVGVVGDGDGAAAARVCSDDEVVVLVRADGDDDGLGAEVSFDLFEGDSILAWEEVFEDGMSRRGGCDDITIAVEDGDDLILNGSKIFVTNGGIGSIFLVGSKYQLKNGKKGITSLIVEKGMEGYEIGPKEDKMGMRGNPTTSLYFHDVRVPKENVLGSLDDGFKIAMETLDAGRIGIAAQALGIAQAA